MADHSRDAGAEADTYVIVAVRPRQPPIARLDRPEQATYREPQEGPPNTSVPPAGDGRRMPDADGPNPPTPGEFPPADPDVKLLAPRPPSPYRRDLAKSPPDGDESPRGNVPN